MQLVLDCPVRANRLCQCRGPQVARADVVTLLQFRGFPFDLTQRVDPGNDDTSGPVRLRHNAGRRQHRTTLSHDSALPGIKVSNVHDGLLLIDKGILNRLPQTRLIALGHQQVIGLHAHDLPGYRLLHHHGIDADQKALEIEGIEQFRNGRNLIAFARYLLLP